MKRGLLAVAVLAAGLALGHARTASAATYQVCGYTQTVASGTCTSLSDALTAAAATSGPDTFLLWPGDYCPITINGGYGALDFVGIGAGAFAGASFSGPEASLAAFKWDSVACSAIAPSALVTVANYNDRITFRNLGAEGSLTGASDGFSISNTVVTLRDVLVENNPGNGVSYSGGSYNDFEMDNSALLDNGTGLSFWGEGSLWQSTVAGSAGTGVLAHGDFHLLNDTVSHNAVGVSAPCCGNTMQVVSTIVAGNTSDCDPTGTADWENASYNATNLLGASCPRNASSDIATSSTIAAAALNGGPTPSISPPTDALGAASATSCSPDQREFVYTGATCDIGSVQSTASGAQTAVASPGSLDFGTVPTGSATTRSLTIETTGGGEVDVSSVSVTGSGFAVASDTCTHEVLVPATGYSYCSISVSVTPPADGALSGQLTVVDTAGTQTVPLTAAGAPGALTVTSTGDNAGTCPSPGSCTIRTALNVVADGGTVTIPAGTYYVGSELLITRNVTIAGAGTDLTQITLSSLGAPTRIVQVGTATTAPTVSISGVTIENGDTNGTGGEENSGVGGGIWNKSGTVTLSQVTVYNNSATVSGGGIDNDGVMTVDRSFIHGNVASGGVLNGGLPVGGGIDHWGSSLTITNTTIANNHAAGAGGGLESGTGGVNLTNLTISGNVGAGGLDGAATIVNTLLDANTLQSGGDGNCGNGITSGGHNLSTDATCAGVLTTAGDQSAASTSAAVDAGDDEACAHTIVGPHCDIGADETTAAANAAPTASFTASTSGLAASVDGSGSSDSDGTIAAYAWDFGDGTTGSGATASHAYAAAGTYTITLTVTDNGGATASATHAVTVVASGGGATYTVGVGIAGGGTVTSNVGGIACPGSCSASVAGGTMVALTAVPASGWAFAGWSGSCSGAGSCTLVVVGAAASVLATFVVAETAPAPTPAPPRAPVDAGFAIAPARGNTQTVFSFSPTSPVPDDTYTWSFGDGSTATGAAATHSYAAAGTYVVTLTAADALGWSASTTQSVSVETAPPTIKVTWSGSGAYPYTRVNQRFGVTAIGSAPRTFRWKVDGRGGGTTAVLVHAFSDPGYHVLTVKESGAGGRAATASLRIKLKPLTNEIAQLSSVQAERALRHGSNRERGWYVDVALRNVAGPLSGRAVKITLSSTHASSVGSGTTPRPTATTDPQGHATFFVQDAHLETVAATITDVDDNVTLLQKAALLFTDPVDAGRITIAPTTVAADGVAAATVMVTLRDGAGRPTPQERVRLLTRVTGGKVHDSISAPHGDLTDADGSVTFEVRDHTGESLTLYAEAPDEANAMFGPRHLLFLDQTQAGVRTQSTITATPQVIADGSATATVVVALRDGLNQPLAGKSVQLQSASTHAVVTPAAATTGSAGIATFTVKDHTPETVTFSAIDTTDNAGLTAMGTTEFYPHAPSGTTSTIAASQLGVPDDGKAPATITVTLKDLGGAAVAGDSVRLVAGSGHSSIKPSAYATTRADGTAAFTVSDTRAEQVTYGVADLTHPSVKDLPSVTITYGYGNEVQVVSEPGDDPSFHVVVHADDGADSSAIQILQSQHRGTLRFATAAISGAGSGKDIDVHVSDHFSGAARPETVTLTFVNKTNGKAYDHAAVLPFVPRAELSRSAVTAEPSSVPADKTSTATVSVDLKTGLGDPAAGKDVTLALLLPNGQPSHAYVVTGNKAPASAPDGKSAADSFGTDTLTDASGQVTFTIADDTVETVHVVAQDGSDAVACSLIQGCMYMTPWLRSGQAQSGGDGDRNPLLIHGSTVTFTSPVAAPASGTASSVVSDQLVEVGTGSALKVTLRNSAGGGIAGKQIALYASARFVAVSPDVATTGDDGVATFSIKGLKPGAVTFSATDTTDAVAIAQTATSTFYGHVPTAAASTTDAPRLGLPSDGTSGVVVVTLRDAGRKPVAGQRVQLHPSSTLATVKPASVLTGADGTAVFQVSDTHAGQVTFTPTDLTHATPGLQPRTITFGYGIQLTVEPVPGKDPTFRVHALTADGSTDVKFVPSHHDGQLTWDLQHPSGLSAGQELIWDVHDAVFSTETVTLSFLNTANGKYYDHAVTLTFVPQVEASSSSVAVAPASVPADGKSTATVTVTAVSRPGVSAPGKDIVLLLTDAQGIPAGAHASVVSGNVIKIPPGAGAKPLLGDFAGDTLTDADGKVTFTIADSVVETVRVIAVDRSDVGACGTGYTYGLCSDWLVWSPSKRVEPTLIGGLTVTFTSPRP